MSAEEIRSRTQAVWDSFYSFTSIWPVVIAGYGFPGYTALYTLVLNLLIAVALTPVSRPPRRWAQ